MNTQHTLDKSNDPLYTKTLHKQNKHSVFKQNDNRVKLYCNDKITGSFYVIISTNQIFFYIRSISYNNNNLVLYF